MPTRAAWRIGKSRFLRTAEAFGSSSPIGRMWCRNSNGIEKSYGLSMNLQRQSQSKPCGARRRRFLGGLLCGLSLLPFVFCAAQAMVPGASAGQEGSVDEYRLKAAMLYNLTQFVVWPSSAYADSHAPVILCIL